MALDDLVYICTKIARQMDADGLSKVFDAAETASSAIDEARPLLENAVKLVDEVCSQYTSHYSAYVACWDQAQQVHSRHFNAFQCISATSWWQCILLNSR